MPVYEVRPEGQGTTKSKVLHRNQLLPCIPNQGAHTEAATLVNFHPATEKVFEAGHDEAGSANNQVTDDVVVEVPETGVYENEINAENNEAAEGYVRQRPVRNRRPPNMLNYDSMGNPTEFPPYVTSVQATNSTFPPQETFWPLIPPTPVFPPNLFPFYPFSFPPPFPLFFHPAHGYYW